MSKNLNVTVLQLNTVWENHQANRDDVEKKLAEIKQKTDMILLPEMFTTGFTHKPETLTGDEELKTLEAMQHWAKTKDAAVVGSFIIKKDGVYYNCLHFVKPDGEVIRYRKRHLFRLGKEHLHYGAGDSRVIVEWRSFKILPLVCYDLRFPVFSRNRILEDGTSSSDGYDLLLYVANWPERRTHHWRTLLIARAIENLSYTVGVNRVGVDGNSNAHNGDSMVVSPIGEILGERFQREAVMQMDVSLDELHRYRKKFPAYLDADNFTIH